MRFEIVRGKSTTQPYFWRLLDASGQVLAVSDYFVAKASAVSAIEAVQRGAATARVDDLT